MMTLKECHNFLTLLDSIDSIRILIQINIALLFDIIVSNHNGPNLNVIDLL